MYSTDVRDLSDTHQKLWAAIDEIKERLNALEAPRTFTAEQVHRILLNTSQGEGQRIYLEQVTKKINDQVSKCTHKEET